MNSTSHSVPWTPELHVNAWMNWQVMPENSVSLLPTRFWSSLKQQTKSTSPWVMTLETVPLRTSANLLCSSRKTNAWDLKKRCFQRHRLSTNSRRTLLPEHATLKTLLHEWQVSVNKQGWPKHKSWASQLCLTRTCNRMKHPLQHFLNLSPRCTRSKRSLQHYQEKICKHLANSWKKTSTKHCLTSFKPWKQKVDLTS